MLKTKTSVALWTVIILTNSLYWRSLHIFDHLHSLKYGHQVPGDISLLRDKAAVEKCLYNYYLEHVFHCIVLLNWHVISKISSIIISENEQTRGVVLSRWFQSQGTSKWSSFHLRDRYTIIWSPPETARIKTNTEFHQTGSRKCTHIN